jgi:hypothetical protein
MLWTFGSIIIYTVSEESFRFLRCAKYAELIFSKFSKLFAKSFVHILARGFQAGKPSLGIPFPLLVLHCCVYFDRDTLSQPDAHLIISI